jgi:regulator of protease activity HflC (stomatin/prohibitin superfamily)
MKFIHALLAGLLAMSSLSLFAQASYPQIGMAAVNGVPTPCYALPDKVICSSTPQMIPSALEKAVHEFSFWNVIPYAALGIMFFGSFFTVQTQTARVVERFGKFNRIARPGLNFKLPFIEGTEEVDLATFQLDAKIETKTKDNVFVGLPITAQWRVGESDDSIQAYHYKLTNHAQITSYLENILLGHVPDMDLDELFVSQQAVSDRASKELETQMACFGIEIVKVMITDISPDEGVVKAMNSINEQTRLAVANKAQGDAEYILKVRQAEADAEVKRLAGVGVAKEREAIAEGWEESIKKIQEATDMDDASATFLLLFTNWTDMLREVGSSDNSTMVFMPSGPDGLQNFQSTMTNALLAAHKQG